jgi:hypothetical protein
MTKIMSKHDLGQKTKICYEKIVGLAMQIENRESRKQYTTQLRQMRIELICNLFEDFIVPL